MPAVGAAYCGQFRPTAPPPDGTAPAVACSRCGAIQLSDPTAPFHPEATDEEATDQEAEAVGESEDAGQDG